MLLLSISVESSLIAIHRGILMPIDFKSKTRCVARGRKYLEHEHNQYRNGPN